jgi:hypothetical protein
VLPLLAFVACYRVKFTYHVWKGVHQVSCLSSYCGALGRGTGNCRTDCRRSDAEVKGARSCVIQRKRSTLSFISVSLVGVEGEDRWTKRPPTILGDDTFWIPRREFVVVIVMSVGERWNSVSTEKKKPRCLVFCRIRSTRKSKNCLALVLLWVK